MAALCGLLEHPYPLLDLVYEEARFDSRLAEYLAAALERGLHMYDDEKNNLYLDMIFYYRCGIELLGRGSLPHLRKYLASSGVRKNISAISRFIELDGQEGACIFEEYMSSTGAGRWALSAYLPRLGLRKMCKFAKRLFLEADTTRKRTQILEVLSGRPTKTVHRLLSELNQLSLGPEERTLLNGIVNGITLRRNRRGYGQRGSGGSPVW